MKKITQQCASSLMRRRINLFTRCTQQVFVPRTTTTTLRYQSSSSTTTTTLNQLVFTQSLQRTHYCSEVAQENLENQIVQLNGWIENIRVLSQSLIFIVLRDRSASIQVVYRPNEQNINQQLIEKLRSVTVESVVCVKGVVLRRPGDAQNENMKTGNYEIELQDLIVLNEAQMLPLQLVNATVSFSVVFLSCINFVTLVGRGFIIEV
jgi:hypothetical protein